MKKKVIHIIPDFPPCGAEMVVLTYLRRFKNDPDYQMSAISLASNQHRLYEHAAENEGLDVTYLNQDICDNGFLSRIRQIKQLHKVLVSKHPDLIHIHLSILWLVCLASIGIRVKKRFHTLHSDPEKTSYGVHVLIDRLCYILFKVKPFALNEEMKDKANRLFKINITEVLRNGIDLESYKNQPKNELRKQFEIPEGCFVLGHVGRFNKVKNHTKIIKVFRELKILRPESKLLLVGDGEEMLRIKEMVKSLSLDRDVIFTGARTDVPQMMAIMDCFIFPSLFEGLGIVLLEAQAAGLKCVVSDTVPEETTVTNNVYRLSLSIDSKIWAKVISGESQTTPALMHQSIDVYDINNIIISLKNYYGNE